ncbi:26006_t:CDS:2 [Racocetra persica]|uniref:26006_t:CDS:1 n=1 Tax=Racocetra persica TaxID=160502 RepID=A0ACA9LWS9_9GLOM|nr:26006_t:CDS:2 [Racocetra persica]
MRSVDETELKDGGDSFIQSKFIKYERPNILITIDVGETGEIPGEWW